MDAIGKIVVEALARHDGQGPLYRQLGAAVTDLIARRRLAPGTGLPSERELAQLTGLSRVTVRNAIRVLVDEGRLVQRQGSGTYVAMPRGAQPVQELTSLSDDMRRRGMNPRSAWIARGLHPPLGDEMMALGLAVGDMVARLERVRLSGDAPVAIERASLPAAILPDPQSVDQSLYDLLASRGIRAVRAVQRLSAANATPRDAEALGILPGGAVLKVERISFLPGGRAMELTRSFYRGDVYDVVTELK